MVGKVVASLASIMLVVGIVIGVVVVNRNGSSNNGDNASASIKAVTSICAPTDFKDACMNSLNNVAKNESATLKDYIVAAIQATIEETVKSLKVVESVKVDASKDPRQHMAVEDCKELLQYANDDLQDSFSMVSHSDLYTINDRVFEILNWFTAVVSYQQTCLDQLEMPEYKTPIENGLGNTTQLTSNAINIVASISDILQAFNIQIKDINKANSSSNSGSSSGTRRLLEVTKVGHDRYPTWFHDRDRKLLNLHNGGRGKETTPNAIVAKDGSGQYKTISSAVAAIPKKRQGRWIIYVKAGVYKEVVIIPKYQMDVFMYGDGPKRTIVTASKNYANNITTKGTATFTASGNRFIVEGMGFHNTAGPKGHQAVAYLSSSEMSAHFNCRFEGYQDTLYYLSNRQFYRNCVITGTVDFIFGEGTALIQDSVIVLRMPDPNQQNIITADGNFERNAIAGLVLQKCKIVPERQLFPNRFKVRSFLGRPWKRYSTTAIMESEIGDLIQPEGWMIWEGKNNHKTAIVAEYGNWGTGANTNKRVKWNKFRVITNRNEALRYTASIHLEAGKDPLKWVRSTGVPVDLGLTK